MKSRNALFATVLAALLVPLATVAVRDMRTPGEELSRSVLPSQVHERGRILAGSRFHDEFTLTNDSGRDIEIAKVETSCSCTVVSRLPSIIPSGGSIVLPVDIAASDEAGQTKWIVALHLGAAGARTYEVHATLVRIAPKEIVFSPSKRNGSENSLSFTLNPLSVASLKITDVKYDKRYFTVNWSAAEEDGSVRMKLGWSPSIPFGGFSKTLRITTQDSPNDAQAVEIKGYVLKPIEPDAQLINFGVIEKGHQVRKLLKLRATYGGRIRLVTADVEPGGNVEVALREARYGASDCVVPVIASTAGDHFIGNGRITLHCLLDEAPQEADVQFSLMAALP